MTDRDRLIELLRNSGDVETWNHYTDDFKKPDPIESLAIYLLANGVTVNEWRPASEPPKESGERCLCYTGTGFEIYRYAKDLSKVDKYDMGFFRKEAGWYGYDSEWGYYKGTVTHWMPLPKPPKEVE